MTGSAAGDTLRAILDLARWAPSGDNTQPWRFELLGEDRIAVHGFDTRSSCVYDLDGHPSHLSHGALLESLSIAATRFGLGTQISRRGRAPDRLPVWEVLFTPGASEDPLHAQLPTRSVQRRPLSTRPLAAHDMATLESAPQGGLQLIWMHGWRTRLALAWLAFRSAHIRLTTPEAYRVHREVIEWNSSSSATAIPDRAIGAGPLTLAVMRWAMQSWSRVRFLNRFLAGTVGPRLELDFVPNLLCGAHFVLLAPRPLSAIDDYVAAGRALQRVWLTASSLGIQMQPLHTLLVFARYARERRRISMVDAAQRRAREINDRLSALLGGDALERAAFIGRVGYGPQPTARSTRRSIEELLWRGDTQNE
jgi:nitroreductase